MAVLWVTLSAFEQSPGEALGDVAQRADSLGVPFDELGVREADRSTAGVSVAEEFDPPTRGNRGLGQRATARIAVHLADPEVIGRAISRASEDLHASIDGPHWFITPANPARLEAARQAAGDARRKAEAYAAGVGATLDIQQTAPVSGFDCSSAIPELAVVAVTWPLVRGSSRLASAG